MQFFSSSTLYLSIITVQYFFPGVYLPLCDRSREGNQCQLLSNLLQLCRAEQEGEVGYKSSLCQAVRANQILLAQKLMDPSLVSTILKLFR